jgi:hypothetical protein
MKVAHVAAAAAILAVALIGFITYSDRSEDKPRGPSSPSVMSVTPTPAPAIRTDTAPLAENGPTKTPVLLEIANSTDARATYDKYKSMPDPTGAIAYALTRLIGDCPSFVDPVLLKDLRMRSTRGDIPARDALIDNGVARCKGFAGWDQQAMVKIYEELMGRSVEARYAPAVATWLAITMDPKKQQENDATLKGVLAAGYVDGDVVNAVYSYIYRRNGQVPGGGSSDPQVVEAAWALLTCNFGSPCDETNPRVLFSCLNLTICAQDLDSLMRSQYPTWSAEKWQEVARMESVIGARIRSRDWEHLGL